MAHFLDDERLGLEHKGLLAFYLREKHSVEVSPPEIHEICNTGIHKAQRLLRELRAFGYCQQDKFWNEQGKIYYETWLYAYKNAAQQGAAPDAEAGDPIKHRKYNFEKLNTRR